MAVFIDSDYVDALLTSAVRIGIFTDDGTYNTAAFDQVVLTASQAVVEAARQAGFTLGDTTTNETVKHATYDQFLILTLKRRGLKEDGDNTWNQMLEDIRAGKIPLDGENPDEQTTVGAASFTSSDPDDSSGIALGEVRPQVFRRLRQVF